MIIHNRYYAKQMIQQGFYQNRNDNGRDYNYDITPLIQNFDFYDFIDYAERFKEEIKDYGAFIVITNKQYSKLLMRGKLWLKLQQQKIIQAALL